MRVRPVFKAFRIPVLASASRLSNVAGTYYSNWVTRSFGATVYCIPNDNGTGSAGVGTGWQDRSIRVGATWTTPPYAGTPTGGNWSGNWVTGSSSGSGNRVNYGQFSGSGSANATGYNNQTRYYNVSAGAWMPWVSQVACVENVGNVQGQSQGKNGYGTSGWYDTGSQPISVLTRVAATTCN